jgi:uncharacterized iron-regulated membrane protein
MKKNFFKKIIGKLHLWLGLASGLVVFIVSITGCIYVFEQEINRLLQTGVYRDITPQNTAMLGPGKIYQEIASIYEGDIQRMNATIFPLGQRASVIWVMDRNRKYTAFLQNPYSGEIIASFPYSINFWAIVLGLHTSLLIPGVGGDVVAVATLVFVIMLISGLVLWMPASKKGYNQRFRIKWTASPKRLTYDLHYVLGFYLMWIAIFIAITGLAMSYQWVKNGIYYMATGGETAPTVSENEKSIVPKNSQTGVDLVNNAFKQLTQHYPDAAEYFITYPTDSLGTYVISIKTGKGLLYNRHDTYLADQYSGEILAKKLWDDKNAGEILQEANYNIHVGAILGFPGKLLAFFASLVSASLPVTGFMIWWGRKKKKKNISPKVRNIQLTGSFQKEFPSHLRS